MADLAYVREYFSRHAELWNRGHYSAARWPRVYPLGAHRVRITLEQVVSRLGTTRGRLADLGCGGGDLCAHAAELGFDVTGMDVADGMVAQARARVATITPPDAAHPCGKVELFVGDVLQNDLPPGRFDVVTALGLLEYLPADEPFFHEAFRLLRPGGVLAVSARNRLFNLASLNAYTAQEIAHGCAGVLLETLRRREPDALPVPLLREFSRRLAEVAEDLGGALAADLADATPPEEAFPAAFGQPRRQHSPDELAEAAGRAGFVEPGFVGVHPHPLPPALERRAPRFFNRLAYGFEVFETSPLSLRWSSAMIAAFTKPC